MKAQYKIKCNQQKLTEALITSYRRNVESRGGEVDLDDLRLLCSRIAHWLIEGRKESLVIIGKVGTGKTTLMKTLQAILRVHFNYGCTFIQAMQLQDAVLDYKEFYQNQCLEGKYPGIFLLIDDIGREPVMVQEYGNIIKPFERIVESRYDKQLPIIVTTNFNLEEIGNQYGERVMDRLKEMADIISFTNDSYRR